VVHVASSRRSHGSEVKDGRFNGVGCDAMEVGSNYPSLVAIFLLAHRAVVGGIPLPPHRLQDFIFAKVWVCFMS
jgi:hypothetical protein